MNTDLRIGIVGTGNIAHMLAEAMAMTEGIRVVAVASRSEETGRVFAAKYDLPAVYTSPTALAQAEDVDLVYIATPHPKHYEACMQVLAAGKPVLCEKPLTTNLEQTKALFAEANARGLFLMESMWTRFLPTSQRAREWIEMGRIGKVTLIDSDWAFPYDPAVSPGRLVDPALGGGALFDIGVYGIAMSSYYIGENPECWTGLCTPYVDGVDGSTALTLRYPGGALATVHVSLTCETPVTMTIYGEKGRIVLPRFYMANDVLLYEGDTLVDHEHVTFPQVEGYCWELAAVRDYIRAGITESPVVPARDSIAAAEVMCDMMHRFFPAYYN